MKLLHTSDWHVGKKIRGRSRADEHRAVLAEIVDIARGHDVDAVLVAGDVFETASPTPESEEIVYRALLALADAGTSVFLIGGNHDNTKRLAALQPIMELGRIHVVAEATKPEHGGVRSLAIGDETLVVASLPFVSQSRIVRAAQLMEGAAFEHAGVYADRIRSLVESLTSSFSEEAVNIVLMHAFVHGGASGGGERSAHLVDEYAVSAQAFPATASYVALGHLHAPQKIAGASAIHYSGSPLQLDFGESNQQKSVNVIDAGAGAPAAVDTIPLNEGIPLLTIRGDLDSLRAQIDDAEDAWLRVIVQEARRADLADDVRTLLGDRVVEVVVDMPAEEAPARQPRRGRSPAEMFSEYLAELQVKDPAIEAMFAELLESEGLD